jgi:hypothetical protein
MSKAEKQSIAEFNIWFEENNHPIVLWIAMRKAYLNGFMKAMSLSNIKVDKMTKKAPVTKASKLIGKKVALKKPAKIVKKK